MSRDLFMAETTFECVLEFFCWNRNEFHGDNFCFCHAIFLNGGYGHNSKDELSWNHYWIEVIFFCEQFLKFQTALRYYMRSSIPLLQKQMLARCDFTWRRKQTSKR